MIITLLLNLISYILNAFISIFPVGTGFSPAVHSAFASLGGYFYMLNPLVPISTLVSAVSIVIAAELSIYAFRSLKWIISHIPMVGGKG